MNPALRQLGPGLVSYVVEVAGEDRTVDFVVVFRPEDESNAASVAKGRLQWFVSVFVEAGDLREILTDQVHEASYPTDTLFLLSAIENEAFWCGPSQIDESIVRKASHLPDVLRWEWEPCDHLIVNEMNTSVGEA